MDFRISVEGFRLEGEFRIADLEAMLSCIRRSRRAIGGYFSTVRRGRLLLGVNMFLLTDDNPGQAFSFNPVDKKGNPATIENVKWTVSDPTLLTLSVSGDNMTATIASAAGLGVAQLNVTFNPTGDDAVTVSAALDVQVVAGEAFSATIVPVNAPPVSPQP
jgi:hypothetical protein